MQNLQIYPHLSDIAAPYPAILLDAYGVFWGGNQFGPLPGSKEAMQHLVAQGKIVGILSNTTQLSDKECKKLQSHGLLQGQHFHFYITSGDISRQTFLHSNLPFPTPHKKYFLSCLAHPKFSAPHAIFEGSPYTETKDIGEADFIYISIPHISGEDQTDPDVFRPEVHRLAKTGLTMVCSNPDRFAHEGNPPRPVVRQGCIAALYEQEGGKVFYIGKPYAAIYEAAMKHFHGLKPAQVLMVGDTPETDIRGARAVGMSTALVTNMGIMAERVATRGLAKAFAEIPDQDIPEFYIELI